MNRSATIPSQGIYYAIPKSREIVDWDILDQLDSEAGGYPIHYTCWDSYVLDYLRIKLGLNEEEIKKLKGQYRGLPRGRIEKTEDGIWKVQHGNDTPSSIMHLILAEFGLLALYKEKKVIFEYTKHESMLEDQKQIVWDCILSGRKKFSSYRSLCKTQGNFLMPSVKSTKNSEDQLTKEKVIEQSKLLISKIDDGYYVLLSQEERVGLVQSLRNCPTLTMSEMINEYKWVLEKLDSSRLKVGVKYAGGIIVYLDVSGKHGIVMSPETIRRAPWGYFDLTTKVNNFHTDKGIGTGKLNTQAIIEHVSEINVKSWFSSRKIPIKTAARICSELNINGFNDWYLPSEEELSYVVKMIPDQEKYTSLPGEVFTGYWSSSFLHNLDPNSNYVEATTPFATSDDDRERSSRFTYLKKDVLPLARALNRLDQLGKANAIIVYRRIGFVDSWRDFNRQIDYLDTYFIPMELRVRAVRSF